MAVEIDNTYADGMLPMEFQPVQLAVAQRLPLQFFTARLPSPEPAGDVPEGPDAVMFKEFSILHRIDLTHPGHFVMPPLLQERATTQSAGGFPHLVRRAFAPPEAVVKPLLIRRLSAQDRLRAQRSRHQGLLQ